MYNPETREELKKMYDQYQDENWGIEDLMESIDNDLETDTGIDIIQDL